MSKIKEKELAKEDFIYPNKNRKEISLKYHVTEKTVSVWVKDGNWEKERTERLNSLKNKSENIQRISDHYANKTLRLLSELEEVDKCIELNKKLANISDDVRKWNKRLESLNKEQKTTLSTYIYRYKKIFSRSYVLLTNLCIKKPYPFQAKHLDQIINTYQ